MTHQPAHPYVRADGSKQEYKRVTDMPCPVCNTHGDHPDAERYLALVSVLDNSATLECRNCGHNVYMRKEDVA